MNVESLLFALLRIAVCGEPVTEVVESACTPEMLEQVYALASHHDLAHLVGQAVSKLELPESEVLTKCKQAAMQAFARYMRQSHAYEQICAALEEAQIPFIPLKGSVLREHYPEPWMRTSCDIDILVREEMLDAAVSFLTEKMNCVADNKGDHDISLHLSNGVHLELHYDTIQERYEINGCRNVLGQIWEDAKPRTPGSVHYLLSDAMFYFYHIAHMAKHFINGGCGVRTFLDVWILTHKVVHNSQLREDMLRAGGLLKFAQAAEAVADFWFLNQAPDTLTQAVSDYVLRAGTYGDNDNRAAIGQAKMGKLKYLFLRRVFMPYDFLKAEYPILKKHKWLTPVYQVVRWFRMVFSGGLRRTVCELKANAGVEKNSVYVASDIIRHLEL